MDSTFSVSSLKIIIFSILSLTYCSFMSTDNHNAYSFFHSSADPTTFLIFENPSFGYNIKYPQDWQKEAHLDNFITFLAPREESSQYTYPAAVGIKSQLLNSSQVPLSTIIKDHSRQLLKLTGFTLLDSQPILLSNKIQAHKIIFTATDEDDVKRKSFQVLTKYQNKAFLFTYKALIDRYDSYLNIANAMVESFTIIQK